MERKSTEGGGPDEGCPLAHAPEGDALLRGVRSPAGRLPKSCRLVESRVRSLLVLVDSSPGFGAGASAGGRERGCGLIASSAGAGMLRNHHATDSIK